MPQGNDYYDISAADATHTWAVGDKGTISFHDGSEWSLQNSGTNYDLRGVTALDANHVWAAGDFETVLFFDGTTWSTQTSGGFNFLSDISALDANHVWAVGGGGTILFFDGTTWSTQASGTGYLYGVSALDANHVWAVGSDGSILFFNGTTWSPQASGTIRYLRSVSALDATRIWAVGDGGTILFYNGSTWSEAATGLTYDIDGVSALDAHHVWACMSDGAILFYNGSSWTVQATADDRCLIGISAQDTNHVWAVGKSGIIRFYNGSTWTDHTSGTMKSLYGVSAIDRSHAWAVGEGGTILFCNGTSCVDQASGTMYRLNDVSAYDTSHVWAVGNGGTILFYDGSSWSTQLEGSLPNPNLYGVSALDQNHVWAVGEWGLILFFDGYDWYVQSPASTENNDLIGVSTLDQNHVWAVGAWDTVRFYNGSNWFDQNCGVSGHFNAVSALDQNHVWVVGNSGTIAFYNGSGWIDQSSIEMSQFDLNGICTLDANHVWASAQDWSGAPGGDVVFYDGSDWSDMNADVGSPLEDISVIEESYIWSVGWGGAVLLGAPTYTVTSSVSGFGGVVRPSSQTLNYWSEATIEIIPDEGYHVAGVTDNGTPVPIADPYIINNIKADHNVVVTFANTTSYSFYFAEGYTGSGFQEYLCLGQLTDTPLEVDVTYLFKDSTSITRSYGVPALSRFTVDVNGVVGPDQEVSIKCEANSPFIAERPMYFNYTGGGGDWTGGHDVVGATVPALNWYFAEGYTGMGFDEYICVLNPGANPANLTFRFQTQEEGLISRTGYSVGAHTRGTFKVNEVLGPNYQTSLKIESSHPVVAERPMYFNYQNVWTGGHCVMGAQDLSKAYYLAEGTTRGGFHEWLTLQNPNPYPIVIDAVYIFGPGQGDPIVRSYGVGEGQRTTIFVEDAVGAEKDVSIKLTSSSYFLAERPMYFNYSGEWSGGHCVIGAAATSSDWAFAEGYTGDNFSEWLCIQNPGDSEAKVEIVYYTQEAGALPARTVGIPAGSRSTISVNTDAGFGYQLSVRLRVTSGSKVVVERPMYFNYNSTWTGGHDVVGFRP